MSDIADDANELVERQLRESLANRVAPWMPKVSICTKCGKLNDRAPRGYCVCSDCVETNK